MLNILRCSLVVVLATVMTISPALVAQTMGCGCSAPEPVSCWGCGCDHSCDVCGSCSADAYVVPTELACCGETVVHEAQPSDQDAYYPEAEQAVPEPATEAAPMDNHEPKPAVMPKAESPVTAETPAEQPAAPMEYHMNDLAAPPVTDTPVAEPKPEVPPVEETPAEPESEPLDDLFAPPAADPTPVEEESAPADEPKESEDEPAEESDSLDDLFGKLNVPGGLESEAPRTWTDNTAKYHCEAKLLGVSQGKVVLAKVGGKISQVPLRRLSERDLSFVYQQVLAKRELLARRAETERVASVWSE